MAPTKLKPPLSLYWSVVVTAALAAMLVGGTFWFELRMQSDQVWVRHTLTIRNEIAQLRTLVQDAEIGQQGYLLTGRGIYLARYTKAAGGLPAELDKTAILVAANPQQSRAVRQLRELVQEKLTELRTAIDESRAGHTKAALAAVNTGQGLRTTDHIRRLLSGMEAEEDRRLAVRHSAEATSDTLAQIVAAIAFFLICAVGILSMHSSRRFFSQLAAARDELILANQALVDQISQREQVESQLRQAQKMDAIGKLTGGIAHDFNNMLAVIASSLDLMQRRIKKGDYAIERFVEGARKATERSAALTKRLLAFARQQPLTLEPVDANRMITNMSDLLRSTLGEHILIETVLAAGLWSVNTDAHQLENAILNIAINARDAMPEGGKLTIETANAFLDESYSRQQVEVEPGQFVMIAVTDTGVGMEQDVVARAYDPFFTTKSAGKGTGLGLSQVYGFIKQSHGHIKIYSEVGVGTTVKIYLPRLIAATDPAVQARPQPAQKGDGQVVLVVEDDPLMLKLTTEAVRELGYTVFSSDNAAEALAILDSKPEIELLFTDVVMPEVNGKKLADEALRQRPDLKVLFTTGYTSNAVVHGGVLDPGLNLLSKPFTLEQIATKLRTVMEGSTAAVIGSVDKKAG